MKEGDEGMTGLIRKDMYCLKNILMTFFLVTAGVILLAVLLLISARCGNIALAIREMKEETGMGEEAFYYFFRIPIWLTLFIPMAFLSMIVECFKEDRKAGFAKTMLCMPLTDAQIVGSRYLSCLLFAVLGMAGSFVAAFFVSLASDTFALKELMQYMFCFGGALLVYMSFVMFMLYALGVEKADLIQCVPFLVLFVAALVTVQKKISRNTPGRGGFLFHESDKFGVFVYEGKIMDRVSDCDWLYGAFFLGLLSGYETAKGGNLMAGLLYKDFVAVKGKLYVTVMLVLLVLMLAVRIAVPAVYIDEMVWAVSVFASLGLYAVVVGMLEISLIAADEGRKQKQYFLSLPISGKQYVASKYLFLLLAFWVVLSFSVLLQSICLIRCENEAMQEIIMGFDSLLPILTCGFMLISAIELPFFIGIGTKRGRQVKTGLLLLIFFLIIVFLLFGDLTLLDRINFMEVILYMKNHPGLLLCLQVFAPYGVLVLYYVSYRMSCVFFANRGWEND